MAESSEIVSSRAEPPSFSLKALARDFPNLDSVTAEIARLSGGLTLPMPTVHVLSDIHGEDRKLRHVINNASGTLRPLVERLLGSRIPREQFEEFLTLLFYPAEVIGRMERVLTTLEQQRDFAARTLELLFEVIRELVSRRSLYEALKVFPKDYRELLTGILHAPASDQERRYVDAVIEELVRRGCVLHLIHLLGRLIRNLAIDEIVIAGDCWDRGPRGDKVVDYLMQQPKVSFVWGNHDMAWLGACLGHPALICHVLRVSLRYGRLEQLEEGYGISLHALEALTRSAYAGDSASCFRSKSPGLRDPEILARMHKAVAVLQQKLEGEVLLRHPEWQMSGRRLLHHIQADGCLLLPGARYPLRDAYLPTVDPADPYRLAPEEVDCLHRLQNSFLSSKTLWKQMHWMVTHGSMSLVREENLIFHGCIPVDSAGCFLPMMIRGKEFRGRALFEAIEHEVYRLIDRPDPEASDLLWYLWSGPNSPLFGKDRITTFERDFIAEEASHVERKNPYFSLIHEEWFCRKILQEFGIDPEKGLIVNGHVPVHLEKGESPLKRCGKAITIDGAFSEAYGDHGFTLVIDPEGTLLARHHHFESVEAAIFQKRDIVPTVTPIRRWAHPRCVADSRHGVEVRHAIESLEALAVAYRTRRIPQTR